MFALAYLITAIRAFQVPLTYPDTQRKLPCQFPDAGKWENELVQWHRSGLSLKGPKNSEFLNKWYQAGWEKRFGRFVTGYFSVLDDPYPQMRPVDRTDDFAAAFGWYNCTTAIEEKLKTQSEWDFISNSHSMSPEWITFHLSTIGAIGLFAWYYRSANPVGDDNRAC